ncbi:MAG: glutamate-5-semialdehyde dehydrogenase [Erysipelotrichaceae bacterium]|nr:glutamate-5-semialdehyde dehydrogenase [Erysipelotrichaceae bacterium]
METRDLLKQAKEATKVLNSLDNTKKNEALLAMAEQLILNTEDILKANEIDIKNVEGKMGNVMIDRLKLSKERIEGMANGLRDVAKLPDPTYKAIKEIERDNGLKITKMSVPMGVVAVIYESRPNVTSDVASLCLKSGNVAVLRSGKEAINSATAIVKAMHEGLKKVNLPTSLINLVSDTSRESANEIMKAVGLVDLLIPRGGKGLIKSCVENALVPTIETGTGICHIYVDESADFDKALNIIENAKTSRPSVCNAEEVLLVNENVYKEFLPLLKKRLVETREKNKVELRLDKLSKTVIDGVEASETDFDTEFLDYILAVKVVKDVHEAIDHINEHSTGHSEAIITENENNATLFTNLIDSAAVYVNASTRFSDGGEFGLGCEIGISTQKLHARGPMGLEELTTYKYIIKGEGQVR